MHDVPDLAYLRGLLAHATDILLVLDREAVVRYVSESSVWILGRDPGEFVGMAAFDFVHPDDVAAARASFARDLAIPGLLAPFRFRLADKRGEWRWFEVVGNNRLEDPAVCGLVISARDVTDTVAAEATIRFQASLLGAVDQAIVATDLAGRVTYWQPAAARLFGWTVEEMLGNDVLQMLSTDSTADQIAAIQSELSLGQSWAGELLVRRRTGAPVAIWITASPVRDARGQPTGTVSVLTDLTERKQAQATQAGLAAVVASSQEAIIAEDLKGIVTDWSPGAERLFGYTAPEMVGRTMESLVPAQRLEERARIVQRVRHGEHIAPYETLHLRKDGQQVHVIDSMSPILDAAGNVTGAASVKRDISERKQTDKEQADLYASLLERERQLHDLMAQLLLNREERRARTDPKLASLSPREREVLKLLAHGKTNREIGESLGCALLTARNHVDHVLTKLGVGDRTEAAVWATQRGLIDYIP